MVTITFIYKIKNIDKTFYGKYVANYISDDDDGLDIEIKNVLLKSINKYRNAKNINHLKSKNLTVGLLSCSKDHHLDYFSNREIKCFDFYYKNLKNTEIYFNGKKIT